jgi:predicted DNA-binding protein with PD1-like motif
MHFRKVGDREHLVVLERDERVVASLLRFAADHSIQGGWVSGLGSIKHVEMGYYDLPRKAYFKRQFEEDMELVGAQGNFAMHGSEPVLHLHCSISGPELISFCGHLFEAKVAVTTEFLVKDFGVRVDRPEVPEIGLRLIQPEKPAKRKESAP